MSVDRFQLETAPRLIDAMEVDLQEGVPPSLINDLAVEVSRLLIRNGIDPNTAYYRGSRDGDPDEITAADAKIRRDELDGEPNPQYTLGKYETLFSEDGLTNPLHLAGVTDNSYLDVYDGAMIDAMDPGQEEGINKVVPIPEGQLALAAVARVYLRYDIINQDVEY